MASIQFYNAVSIDSYELVNQLLHDISYVDINKKYRQHNGQTALHIAVLHQNDSMVQLLLSKGANVDIKDNKGYIPVYYAHQSKSFVIVNALLQKGASAIVDNRSNNKDENTDCISGDNDWMK